MNVNDHFVDQVKKSLNAIEQDIDSETRQQLANIRRYALNQPKKINWLKLEYWLPASSLALCSLLAVFLIVNPEPSISPSNTVQNQAILKKQDAQVAVMELLNNGDDLDLLSDPDFYIWADEVLNEGNPDYAV
ncbi:MAG: hypothetical protein Q8M99_03940 [Methylotenera sp.]|nr:hypothetical protein [Methylotenera sp.]